MEAAQEGPEFTCKWFVDTVEKNATTVRVVLAICDELDIILNISSGTTVRKGDRD
jgi:hypothetical protein